MTGLLLFEDLETTGLKPGPGHAILEIALVVTDLDFQIKGQLTTLVPADTRLAYETANDFVRKMHTENGLWRDHAEFLGLLADMNLRVATKALEDHLIQWAAGFGIFPGDKSTLFCGQGLAGVDNDYMTAYLPRVRQLWGHRAFDISAWLDLVEKWYGCKTPARKAGIAHRALDDVLNTIETARWVRRMFWREVSPARQGAPEFQDL